jgi:hypothetical protein
VLAHVENGYASRISLTGARTTPEQPRLGGRRSLFLTSPRRPSHLDNVLGLGDSSGKTQYIFFVTVWLTSLHTTLYNKLSPSSL